VWALSQVLKIAEARALAHAGASPEAIRFHYDTGTEFFRAWLGEELVYSAGRWGDELTNAPPAKTLEQAQRNKNDFHLNAIRAGEGGSLLDIGCGWGALMRRAIEDFGIVRAVGLTLSAEQFVHIRAQRLPEADVRLESYEDLLLDHPVDGAVTIGAFEHFARPGLARAHKVTVYKGFFERARAFLKPEARLSLQTIFWETVERRRTGELVPSDVFPESDLPYLDEVFEAAQPFFRTRYVETNALDYTLTLREWLKRLRNARKNDPGAVDDEKFRFHEDYLRRCIVGFARGRISLARIVFQRL
jgi:cyclopropane-fatty-acyl-phospholipid synthase